jgi:hypothetical protein
MIDLVNRLLNIEADLVVTITMPLDRRRPGNDEDRIRLRNLHADARRKVLDTWDRKRAAPLLAHLDSAADSVELGGGAHGLAIVATTEIGEAHLLPFPVRDVVALATTPATRLLIQGLRRIPRYRVLVVSDRATRLFEAVRDEAAEVKNHGFPLAAKIVPRDRRAVAGRFARSPGRDDQELWKDFYRDVDEALSETSRDDELPIVLAGVRTTTALFEEVTRHGHLIVGRLDGAHDQTNAHDLGRATWPLMQERLRERRRQVVGDLAHALHAGNAVTGLDEVWQLGREGRGHLLVVEEDYRGEPAREVDGRLVAPQGTTQADVMDDPVDEIIEHVVRLGGSAEFVEPDAMVELGRIGLLLR